MLQQKIDIGEIRRQAVNIESTKLAIKHGFAELFDVSERNSRLLSLYINYKLNIELETELKLSSEFDLLHELVLDDRELKTLELLEKQKNTLNIFSNQAMSLYVKVLQNKFYIEKFTSNMPQFFEVDETALKGMHLNEIMPSDIRKEHDRYVIEYINQKDNPITKTGALTSFAITHTGKLRVVSVLVKVEYLMLDDIYLAGFVVPHPRNKQALILSNISGKIVGMNRKSQSLMGSALLDNPYSLFLSIPLLMKYFYPSIEQHLRYNRFSKREKKLSDSNRFKDDEIKMVQNFKLETELFPAFIFKYMLDSGINMKGLVQ